MASDMSLTTGVVVWSRLGYYPWWPAVIINREIHEASVEPGVSLPPVTKHNRMVEFFNDEERVAIIDLVDLVEFTTNLSKLHSSTGRQRQDVIVACQEAKAFIEERGLPEQKASLANNPIEAWLEQNTNLLETTKRVKLHWQGFDDVSEGESSDACAKVMSKEVGERARALTCRRKRNAEDSRKLDEVPTPKREKHCSGRTSTGSNLVHKPEENPSGTASPWRSEKSKSGKPLSGLDMGGPDTGRGESVDLVDRSVVFHGPDDAVNLEDKLFTGMKGAAENGTAKQTEPAVANAPRSVTTRSNHSVDRIAAMQKPDVRHILKENELAGVQPVPANSDDSTRVAIAEQMSDAVAKCAAVYIKDLQEVARKRDELQKDLERLGGVRRELLGGIRGLNAKKFPVDLLIRSGIGNKLIETMDKLREHSAEAANAMGNLFGCGMGKTSDGSVT